jgi:hypothetical protein
MNGRELLEIRERLDKLERAVAEVLSLARPPQFIPTEIADAIAAGDLRPGGVIRMGGRQKAEKPAG